MAGNNLHDQAYSYRTLKSRLEKISAQSALQAVGKRYADSAAAAQIAEEREQAAGYREQDDCPEFRSEDNPGHCGDCGDCSGEDCVPRGEYRAETHRGGPDFSDLWGKGLYYYKDFWDLREVDVLVNGEALTGIPIFTNENTLRVINEEHSYFIPMKNVDYIRTTDGLCALSQFDDCPRQADGEA